MKEHPLLYDEYIYNTYDQNKDQNIFEAVIDDFIISGIPEMTIEIKNDIMSFPIEHQRFAILSILDDDYKGVFEEIKQLTRPDKIDHIDNVDRLDKIVELLGEYVKIALVDKKKFGEVMTPFTLVNDMLDTLPSEVWTNPDLKWLDPTNGIGNFIVIIIQRLMKGLSKWEPDTEKRYKHIVENMIYVGELQPKNMFLYMYAVDPRNKYKLNIYTGSTLEHGFDEHRIGVWGVDKFDVICMNPPFQKFFAEANKKSQPLWDKFVVKVINEFVECGYLVAIHPDSWRRVDGDFNDVKNVLKSKQMLYLELHNEKDGVKTFGASTTFDFYCVRNVTNNNYITTIKSQDGIIQRADISKMEIIPNGMFKEFQKLIAKDGEERVNILYSSSNYGNYKKNQMSKIETEEHKYPCVYLTYKDGTKQLWYSSTKSKGHFGIPKVIWSNGMASTPIIDETGEYGVMNFACSIADDIENLENIQKAMLSDKFIELMKMADGLTHRYNRKAISLFRKDFWKEFI